jgi:hypothetical protein
VKSRKRLVAVIAGTSIVAAGLAGLAYAATQVSAGTAKLVTSPDVFAGSSGPVTVQVSNPSSMLPVGGTSVNMVILHPANGFTIQPPPSPAPSGWHYTLSGTDAVFTGGTIAPGSSNNFTVPTQVSRPAANQSGNWQAKSSADSGETIVLDSTDSTGTMTSTIHVLKVTSAALSAPSGATDNTVTAGQNNTAVSLTVQNGGSGALTVTPKLTAGGGGDSVGTAPVAQSIAGNDGTGSFTFPVAFGTASGTTPRHFAADATATGAPAAIGANTANITIQAASAFAYVANSLSPTTVPSGARTFNLSVNKTGDPSLTLTGATSTVTFQNGVNSFAFPLGADKAVGTGAVTSILSFAGTVPSVPDGVYTGSLHLIGTDANGAAVDKTVSVASVTVDNTGPGVVPTLSSPTLDKNGKPVAKDGTVLTIGGSVFNNGTSGALDQTATVTSCSLTIIGGSSALNQPATCTINKGTLGGTVTVNSGGLPAGTATLTVNIKDAANNTGSGTSSAVGIDNVAPSFASAKTKDVNTILVTTSEPVEGSFQNADWSVNGTTAKQVSFDGSASALGSVITITPQNAFGPNDKPAVSYSRLEPAALGTVHDAPGNNAPTSASLTATDGIFPTAPTLTLVAGKAKFNDTNRFYTNSSSPTLTLGGLSAGDAVVLYEHLPTGNKVVCKTAPATGATASCAASGWTTDAIHNVQGYIGDGTNVTYFGPFAPIVVDHTAPGLKSASVNQGARTVTVTATELIGSGRDFAVDWSVVGTSGGQQVSYAIQSVTVGATPDLRVLHIDPADPNWASGSVANVAYTFVGSAPTDRYADRAGNVLPDSSIAAS